MRPIEQVHDHNPAAVGGWGETVLRARAAILPKPSIISTDLNINTSESLPCMSGQETYNRTPACKSFL